jgi:glycosyltransferase involved in cell wall biosynthesis
MRCPTLAELPPPPPGKTGWPWTEECPQLPDAMPDGRPWPRISIVTPSFNQGAYIEETIRSILLQGYPDLEYIVMDGGSTDGAVDVIRRYAPWLAHWRSEPDRGQADAINKGLALCTGEMFQFINSDDVLLNACLEAVGRHAPAAVVLGDVINWYPDREHLVRNHALSLDLLLDVRDRIHHPGFWTRREYAQQIGGFDESLWLYFDLKFMVKYFERFREPVAITKIPFVRFRYHEASKSSGRTDRSEIGASRFDPKKEKDRMRRQLLDELTQADAIHLCRYFTRLTQWLDQLDQIAGNKHPKHLQSLEVALLSLGDPSVRVSRQTASFLKHRVWRMQ